LTLTPAAIIYTIIAGMSIPADSSSEGIRQKGERKNKNQEERPDPVALQHPQRFSFIPPAPRSMAAAIEKPSGSCSDVRTEKRECQIKRPDPKMFRL
jgi:hypothetical protein